MARRSATPRRRVRLASPGRETPARPPSLGPSRRACRSCRQASFVVPPDRQHQLLRPGAPELHSTPFARDPSRIQSGRAAAFEIQRQTPLSVAPCVHHEQPASPRRSRRAIHGFETGRRGSAEPHGPRTLRQPPDFGPWPMFGEGDLFTPVPPALSNPWRGVFVQRWTIGRRSILL